jgi:hypothetical protein
MLVRQIELDQSNLPSRRLDGIDVPIIFQEVGTLDLECHSTRPPGIWISSVLI